MSTEPKSHWDAVYGNKDETQTSWFRPHLDESLRLIDSLSLDKNTPLLDVGGGRATLVDDLLARGFRTITVLDLSANALDESRTRLGAAAASVNWVVGDITQVALPRVGLWHDRAVFHFLVEPADRARYLAAAANAIEPGGHAVIGTFAEGGPLSCSGLPVNRYAPDALVGLFGPAFEPVASSRDVHDTPFGTQQPFTYVVLRRRDERAAA